MKAGMRVINNPMGSRCVLLMQHTWLYNNKVHNEMQQPTT